MSIQTKCYFYPNSSTISSLTLSQPCEIRRFELLTDSSVNLYNKLCDKIRIAYGSLIKPDDEIKAYWIDEENDFVCFSTDEEVKFAMEMQTAIANSKNLASQTLFKIYVGIKRTNESFSSQSEKSQIHFGVICDGCNGSIKGNRYTCTVCPDYDLCSTCKEKSIHQEHEFIVFDKPVRNKCPYGRQRRFFSKNFSKQQNPSNSSNFQNSFSNIFPLIQNAVPKVNDPETLKNFGEHLKKFLDPFGIDVSYYIDPFQNKQENEKKTQREEEKKEENVPSQTSSFQNIPERSSESLIDLSKDIQNVKLETCLSNESIPNLSFEKLSTENETKNNLESAANSLQDAISNQNFMGFPKLPTDEKDEEKKKYPVNQEAEENEYNVVDIEKEMKYFKCVEQLTNMGYTDEAGWLSRLVIAKDGNINHVLDTLQPSK